MPTKWLNIENDQRRLESLHPIMKPIIAGTLSRLRKWGLEAHIGYAFRSHAKQWMLWKQGREKKDGAWRVKNIRKVVTFSTPSTSSHCVISSDGKTPASLAADIYLLADDRLPADDDIRWMHVGSAAALEAPGRITCGGMWHRPRDWMHIELKNWKQLARDGVLVDG